MSQIGSLDSIALDTVRACAATPRENPVRHRLARSRAVLDRKPVEGLVEREVEKLREVKGPVVVRLEPAAGVGFAGSASLWAKWGAHSGLELAHARRL